jgi:hypothetical protein
MAELWYYTSEGRQMEPVSSAELKRLAASGLLKPTDMVWQEGMPKWIRASNAPGLFSEEGVTAKAPAASSHAPLSRQSSSGPAPPGDEPRERPEKPRRERRRALDADHTEDDEDLPARRRRRSQAGLPAGAKLGLILAGAGVVLGIITIILLLTRSGGVQKLGGAGQGPNNQGGGVAADVFATVQAAIKEGRVTDVDIRGFTLGNDLYREAPEEGALLIGFQVGLGKFIDNAIVDAIRPIFLTKQGEKLGAWQGSAPANPITVKAKAGYAVGGIDIRTGLAIDGFSLTYMKVQGGRLDPGDTYKSDWVAGNGGGPATIGGRGQLVVGICGHLNDRRSPCSLGLIAVPN